ncbi:Multidrug resistance-associated protein [Blattamonas nauphoetae]|uniref:Multidrug resistance-associated protein n=1 Tax=Blattamonas nauphoetae TaxID=2049346 RepID=A0ABQ9XQ26_9EUKA|nr:Multidrug resistance-associated protein [Blattamonas nauphoetae]
MHQANPGVFSYPFFSYMRQVETNPGLIDYTKDKCAASNQRAEMEKWISRFWKIWNKELLKEKPSILRAFVKLRGIPFLLVYLIRLLSIIVTYAITFSMKWLLAWAADPSSRWVAGLGYGGLYAGCYVVKAFLTSRYNYHLYHQGHVFQHTLTRIVGEHLHRMLPQARLQFGSGTLTNLATTDNVQFDIIVREINQIVDLPVQLVLSTVLLVGLLDASSLWGICVLVVLAPLSFLFSRSSAKLKRVVRAETDCRVQKTSESIHGIRVIKMNGWEEPMKEAICRVREREMGFIGQMENRKNISDLLSNSAQILSSLLVVILQYGGKDELSASTLFPALSALGSLKTPIMALPRSLGKMLEGRQILERYRIFLLSEEYPEYERETGRSGETILHITPTVGKSKGRRGRKQAEWTLDDAEEEMEFATTNSSIDNSTHSNLGNYGTNDPETDLPAVELHNATFIRPFSTIPAFSSPKPTANQKYRNADSSQTEPLLAAPSSSPSPSLTPHYSPSDPSRAVLSSLSVSFPRGSHVVVFGSVGCGKSSLLSALLGELDCSEGAGVVRGSVAFLPQTPWLLNATVEENIVFGSDFDAERYRRVVEKCCLEADLEMLPVGDQTEIGERGMTLSGGQRVRVALARACYSQADVVLLDDPFASVDGNVEERLVRECVGELLVGRTVICTTHHTGLVGDFDWGVELGSDGRIVRQGRPESFTDLAATFGKRRDEEKEENNQHSPQTNTHTQTQPTPSVFTPTPLPTSSTTRHAPTGSPSLSPSTEYRLTTTEEVSGKGLSGRVFKFYFSSAPTLLLVLAVVVNVLAELCYMCEPYALSWLSSGSSTRGEVTRRRPAFVVYLETQILSLLFVFPRSATVLTASIRAALHIHSVCISRLFSAPLTYFDVTPTGRLLARFSKDLETVDTTVPSAMVYQVVTVFSIVSSLVGTVVAFPLIVVVLVPVLVLLWKTNKTTTEPTRRSRRFLSVATTHVLHDLLQQYSGMSTIHAFGKDGMFSERSMEVLDKKAFGNFLVNSGNRRFELKLELETALIVTSLCVFAVITKALGKSVGFLPVALKLSASLTESMSNQLRHKTFLENEMTSVEKLEELSRIEQEPRRYVFSSPTTRNRGWPSAGEVEFKNVDVRYRPDLPLSLSSLSLKIAGGSKVGVVGRTGSGKSTLILSLLRLVEAERGEIRIDGKDIQKEVGLHELRLGIGTTPQLPTLFEGSIRFNLDPFEEIADDSRIWGALDEVGMGEFVRSHAEGLDWRVAEDGGNLSVGQQQLICLSRALLKKEKIILLDEATSSIDGQTDAMIQRAIRTCFVDATVITVAHRLVTVGDADVIVVMERGAVVESGRPAELLRKEGSRFWEMGMANGESEFAKLKAMAEEKERQDEERKEKGRKDEELKMT